jgi:RNA polymerase sigma-70 factor (ECF subfamily)
VVHQVFLQVVQNITRVRDPEALRGWIAAVTINAVRSHLRRRSFRRSVLRVDTLATTSALAPAPDYEARQMLEATYDVLDKMPAQERIVFALHHIDKRKLTEVAEMCGCSLATVKRRIVKADRRFCKMANRDPYLRDRVRASPLAARFDLRD